MMKHIKNYLKQRPMTKRFIIYYVIAAKLYGKTFIKLILGRFIRKPANVFKKPQVLQLPITFKCNCDCVMCGMRAIQQSENFTYQDLDKILSDELYSEITDVGVNGGEPFIVSDIEMYICVLLKRLPKLRAIYIISNGYFTDRMLEKLKIMKRKCGENSVKLAISISIDGVESTHDEVRRVKGIFGKAIDTYRKIDNQKELYCDYLGAICTITKFNIININELEALVTKDDINMSYNVATVHRRLFNEDRLQDFSVFSSDEHRNLTAEFFYGKFIETKSMKYFALYQFLMDRKRISFCDFYNNRVTITPDKNISFCATKSKLLGNAIEESSYELFSRELAYRRNLVSQECSACSHYSTTSLTLKGTLKYNSEILKIIGNPFRFRRVI